MLKQCTKFNGCLGLHPIGHIPPNTTRIIWRLLEPQEGIRVDEGTNEDPLAAHGAPNVLGLDSAPPDHVPVRAERLEDVLYHWAQALVPQSTHIFEDHQVWLDLNCDPHHFSHQRRADVVQALLFPRHGYSLGAQKRNGSGLVGVCLILMMQDHH